MRVNLQGWDSLAVDNRDVDDTTVRAAKRVLFTRLGAARVTGIRELRLFWIASGEASARPSRVLAVRYTESTKIMSARAMVAPTAKTKRARTAQYVRDMRRLTLDIVDRIEERLDVDLTACKTAITRDFAKLE